MELEEVVHALLVSLQRLGPGAQVCLAGAGDGVHPTRRPPLEVSQLDSTTPSFSIRLRVRYKVPGFSAPNPNILARPMSS